MPFFENGNVRVHYNEVGSGFLSAGYKVTADRALDRLGAMVPRWSDVFTRFQMAMLLWLQRLR
jgi:hypothetical protein